MKENLNGKIRICGYILVGTLLILSSLLLNSWNHYINALILLLGAVGVYVYVVAAVSHKNWLDIRAVFSGVWLGTLGLATLRLTGYQEPWQNMTWILCAVGYLVFQIGANLGIFLGKQYASKALKVKRKWFGMEFFLAPERLFWVCVATTLIGLGCFLLSVIQKGFIPCFSNDPRAYVDFYTKFHIFSTAATAICGLCYYCIKTQMLSLVKKIILWLCIFYSLILFPVLVVSRGVFIVSALSFTTAVFYLNRRKLWVLILCVAVIGSMYMLMSNLRSLTDGQLNVIFDPNTITVTKPQEPNVNVPSTSVPSTSVPSTSVPSTSVPSTSVPSTSVPSTSVPSTSVPSTDAPSTDSPGENKTVFSFTLSPKLAFLYGYLTVSHDNFNEAVKHLEGYTWGVRQLAPINVILRQQWITDTIEQGEYYQVNVHLNTTNMLGVFYYDLHEFGVVLFMLMWSCLFGLVQALHQESKDPFSLLILGYVMSPVALSFFSTWINSFDLWMLCGTVLIFAFFSCVHFKKKSN